MPVKAAAAVRALLPVLRARLLELCDLNEVVRDIKRASSSSAAAGGGSPQQQPSDTAVSALWEELKIRSEFLQCE